VYVCNGTLWAWNTVYYGGTNIYVDRMMFALTGARHPGAASCKLSL